MIQTISVLLFKENGFVVDSHFLGKVSFQHYFYFYHHPYFSNSANENRGNNNNGTSGAASNFLPSQRILVRTCNGLELRDPPYMPRDQNLPTPPGPPNGKGNSSHFMQHSYEPRISSPLMEVANYTEAPPYSAAIQQPPRAKSSLSFRSVKNYPEASNEERR